jgi:glycosyltransferase involved in cell wall biosynthesis
MENLSLTVLEAMACGAPVVAFQVGGMPDMIQNGDTGWLAEPATADALLGTLQRAAAQVLYDAQLPHRVRREVEHRFSLESEGVAMRRLFESIINSRADISS